MIQEYVKAKSNKLAYGNTICNAIYEYTGWTESCFYVDIYKIQKYVTVLMRKVDIPNIDVNVWTQKNKSSQVNYLSYLM